MKKELDDVREVMIRTHEENIGHRLTLAEKEDSIKVGGFFSSSFFLILVERWNAVTYLFQFQNSVF